MWSARLEQRKGHLSQWLANDIVLHFFEGSVVTELALDAVHGIPRPHTTRSLRSDAILEPFNRDRPRENGLLKLDSDTHLWKNSVQVGDEGAVR